MAIELNPQRKSRTSLITTVVGILAVFIILAFVGSYLYFYITSKSLVKKIEEIKESAREIDNTIKGKEEDILIFQKRINDFGLLASVHKNIGSMFNFVNKNTISPIWFNKFEYDQKERRAFILRGKSDSFFTIEQQIVVFRNNEIIKDVRLIEAAINEKDGLIEFSISVVLKPDALIFEEELPVEAEPLLEVETPTQ